MWNIVLNRMPQGFSVGLAVLGPADEYGDAPVDRFGKLGVAAGAEGRAGAGVGIQQRDVVGRQGKAAFGVVQLLDGMGEERELGAVGSRSLAVSASEQAELHSAVDIGEEAASVLEIEEADQRSRLRDILEEELGCVVGRNSGGEHAARASALVEHAPHRLGEDRVGVDVASRAQREAAGAAHQVAPALGLAESFEVCLVKFGIVIFQRPDHPFAGGRVRGVRDLGTSLGKPLLLLELHPLPRGVPEYAVEAVVVEDFGEGEVPVEELVVAGEAVRLRRAGRGPGPRGRSRVLAGCRW